MKKLLQIPISKALFELIQDYLLGRTQKVRVGDLLSNERAVTSGVPQESVLGPLLFLIYINDLPTVVFSSLALLIADRLKLIFNGRAEQESLEKLQIDLQALHNWSVQNHGKWSLGLMPFGLKSFGLIQLVTWLNFFKLSVSDIGHLA